MTNHLHAVAMVLLLVLSPIASAAQDAGAKPDTKPQPKAKPADEGAKVTNGKLIYQGDPLTRHYRGGVLVGVAFPVYFKMAFQ